jgi:hypothetical protein
LFSASLRYNVSILARSVTSSELDKCKVETVRILEKILALESVPLFTQNTDFLESEGQKWLSTYTRIRGQSSSYLDPPPEYHFHPAPEPQFNNAMIVMANVRAYFQVAYKVYPFRRSLLSNEH